MIPGRRDVRIAHHRVEFNHDGADAGLAIGGFGRVEFRYVPSVANIRIGMIKSTIAMSMIS